MSRIHSTAIHRLRRWIDYITAQKGSGALEVIIGVSVLTVVGASVMTGIGAVRETSDVVAQQSTIEELARNQMEYIFSLPYSDPPYTYPVFGALPAGYTISANAAEYVPSETRIQKITVDIRQGGNTVLTLETLRAREQ